MASAAHNIPFDGIIIRGGGDLASGVIYRLRQAWFPRDRAGARSPIVRAAGGVLWRCCLWKGRARLKA
ncbi:MAG: hypothetical protein U0670_14945 [Anaerolineae bacterium]